MVGTPSFTIPAHPEREFPYSGGVEYVGETIFHLTPTPKQSNNRLTTLVETVLDEEPYRYGDFLNLPMALYLVRDDGTGDVFRVSIRDGQVQLHVLPETESAGLRAMYDRLDSRTELEWRVEREVSSPQSS
jgi:hypothetical protein